MPVALSTHNNANTQVSVTAALLLLQKWIFCRAKREHALQRSPEGKGGWCVVYRWQLSSAGGGVIGGGAAVCSRVHLRNLELRGRQSEVFEGTGRKRVIRVITEISTKASKTAPQSATVIWRKEADERPKERPLFVQCIRFDLKF